MDQMDNGLSVKRQKEKREREQLENWTTVRTSLAYKMTSAVAQSVSDFDWNSCTWTWRVELLMAQSIS